MRAIRSNFGIYNTEKNLLTTGVLVRFYRVFFATVAFCVRARAKDVIGRQEAKNLHNLHHFAI